MNKRYITSQTSAVHLKQSKTSEQMIAHYNLTSKVLESSALHTTEAFSAFPVICDSVCLLHHDERENRL